METSRIQTETQRGKHRPSMVLLAGVSAALLAGGVALDRAARPVTWKRLPVRR